ncbi:MAG: hypothetical protein KFF49_12185 [Bacteroidales bacterium]|nr:hypothetical protein [Bacteroidales bacterium]
MKSSTEFFCIILLLLFTSSCGDNHYAIRGRLQEPDIEIVRFEKDLFSPDPASLMAMKDSLISKYGAFMQLFAWVINAGDLNDSTAFNTIIDFATDRFNNEVYMSVLDSYPDLGTYESEFEKAWANYLYYFPDSVVPRMYSFISGFNNSIIIGDSVLAIGLDRYLGAGHSYYTRLGIYNYLSRKMIPERIVPDGIYAWAMAGWPYSPGTSSEDLLSRMLYEGKLYYFTKSILYAYPDSLLFGFTSSQMKFCSNNEYNMWEYLMEHDMLFSTDMMLIRKLTGEAPFTSYFTSESPGRAGVWIGFRIIESYMKNNPGIDLARLMTDNNYRRILEQAKYNPPK